MLKGKHLNKNSNLGIIAPASCDEKIIINATLRDIEDKLGKNFYKCHKNFLVNINNISDVDKEKRIVKMNNNDECMVGERHLNKLLRILNED